MSTAVHVRSFAAWWMPAWVILVCIVVVGSGCDLLEPAEETVILRDAEPTFRFSFSASDLSSTQTTTLQSTQPANIDLASILQARAFTIEDVRSIRVEEATLEITFPLDRTLGFMEDVRFLLDAEGLPPVVVARGSHISEGTRTVALSAIDSKDIQAYVRKTMQGILTFDTDQPVEDGQYEVEVQLQLAIEVGGF